MQDDAGIVYFCNEGESSNNVHRNRFFSTVLKLRNFTKELCEKNEVSFIDTQTAVNIGALKRSIDNFNLL